MGCGASKNADAHVVKTATEKPKASTSGAVAASGAEGNREMAQVQTTTRTESKSNVALAQDGTPLSKTEEVHTTSKSTTNLGSKSNLEKSVIPEIRSSKTEIKETTVTTTTVQATALPQSNSTAGSKPVAFEIPVDDLKPIRKNSAHGSKSALPKIGLSSEEIAAKLSTSEDRWKDLEKSKETRRSARSLRSNGNLDGDRAGSAKSNPEELKQKLEEKEAKVEQNRQRELEKKKNEQLKRDNHVKKVQQRKKQIQKDQEEADQEDLELDWGGEAKEENTAESNEDFVPAVVGTIPSVSTAPVVIAPAHSVTAGAKSHPVKKKK